MRLRKCKPGIIFQLRIQHKLIVNYHTIIVNFIPRDSANHAPHMHNVKDDTIGDDKKIRALSTNLPGTIHSTLIKNIFDKLSL